MTKPAIMSVDAFRAVFEEAIDRVDAGETIPIERDGVVTARLVPSSDEDVAAVLEAVPRSDDAA